jgi:glycosyltransferase involved in cell wall biosynthesis
MKLKIAIAGTRGIPNHYGGYEQAVTILSEKLAQRGHQVTVYNSDKHPYQQKEWNGVEIIHCYDPEHKIGTAGQFIYDFNCIRHARKNKFDVLLFMGYTSSSVWGRFYPGQTAIICNMDGLEWKRQKYSKAVRRFLQYAETLAVKHSDYHIADSTEIKKYLDDKYKIDCHYIPYGAFINEDPQLGKLAACDLVPNQYYLAIARMEPENNIELILEGFSKSGSADTFVVVGNTGTSYGKKLKQRYSHLKNIRFTEGIFDQELLNSLRSFCKKYFHGHSVGGTNPSLLEAMANNCSIAAHNNPFNKAILGNDSEYFTTAEEVASLIMQKEDPELVQQRIKNNLEKIKSAYNWDLITDNYEALLIQSCIPK